MKTAAIKVHAPALTINSLAQSLSRINRYTGRTNRPSNVASHSILVSRIVAWTTHGDDQLTLAALLHDAHEAYVSDIPTPYKCGCIREIGRALDEQIGAQFEIDPDLFESPAVRLADQIALSLEVRKLEVTHVPVDALVAVPRQVARMWDPLPPSRAARAWAKRLRELTAQPKETND
jgi:hypothetical protein